MESNRSNKHAIDLRYIGILMFLVLLGLAITPFRSLTIAHAKHRKNREIDLTLPSMLQPVCGERILIIAPHPDDETLGCGGYIQRAVAVNAKVSVVIVTNGEYGEAELDRRKETPAQLARDYEKFGMVRQKESLAALHMLGVPETHVTFLGYPNHFLQVMWQPTHWLPENPVRSVRLYTTRSPYPNSMTPGAVFCGQSLVEDMKTVLCQNKPDIVLTVHPGDIHHDHWPTYTALQFALHELAAEGYTFAAKCHVYAFLIHQDWWPAPRAYDSHFEIAPPAWLTRYSEWESFVLTEAETQRKGQALALYKSQKIAKHPLLHFFFACRNELFATVPIETWPRYGAIQSTYLFADSGSSLKRAALDPYGDILRVRLHRNRDRLTVSICTRAKPAQDTSYHISIHSGKRSAEDRIIASYEWQGSHASGTVLANGIVRTVPQSEFRVSFSNTACSLEAPWPIPDDGQRFLMIRAWTNRYGHRIDYTATHILRITSHAAG